MARLFDNALSQYLSRSGAVVTGVPLTMACWFRSDDDTVNQTLMSLGRAGTAGHLFNLRASGNVAGDPVQAIAQAGGGPGTASSTAGFTANTWAHAAAVFASATDRRAFINGGNKGTNATNLTPTVDVTTIGAQNSGGTISVFMSGLIGEGAIWNVALTDAEVALLSTGRISPLLMRPESLVAYWPTIGRHSPEIDVWRGNDLTLNAGPVAGDHPRIIYPSSFRRLSIASSAAATFSAALSAAASLAAALTTSIVALTALGGNAAAAADLSTQITMQSALSGQASVAAALSTQITPAATCSGTAALASDLSTQITPAAAVQADGTLAADLSTSITPATAVQGVATLSGSLSTEIRCAAAVTGVATLSGDLAGLAALFEADVQGEATVGAALSTQIAFAAALQGAGSCSSGLSTAITMAGLLPGVATVGADLEAWLYGDIVRGYDPALVATTGAGAELTGTDGSGGELA